MKRLFNITLAFAVFALVAACHQEPLLGDVSADVTPSVSGDEVAISFNVVAPEPFVVNTRGVDPDGRGIQNLTIFCFDEYGLFISAASTSMSHSAGSYETNGVCSAIIPNTTRIMHLVGNQNMTQFSEPDFVHKHEEEVMSVLEGSAGKIIYWARIEVPANVEELYPSAGANRSKAEAILDWITIETNPTTQSHKSIAGKGNPIVMLRNQAKITVSVDGATANSTGHKWVGEDFEVTGFAVCNTQAFGTVAPFHPDYMFPTYSCSTYAPTFSVQGATGSAANWRNAHFVTLAANKNKLSDIMDVDTALETYVFETTNSSADPVDVIIRGKVNGGEELYYRATLTDGDGEQVLVRRNHHYNINIKGVLKYGVPTFGEALNTPATNNIWLSISDEVKSIQNNDYKLTVDKTHVANNADDITSEDYAINLTFSVESLNSKSIDATLLDIAWAEENQLVSSTHDDALKVGVAGSHVSFNTQTGKGSITIHLNPMPADKDVLEGTILVKYDQLQRKIRVVTFRTQSFTPTWISAQVYGETDGTTTSRANVTLMFTIPDDCPEELFPMNVLITSNELDVRDNVGQVLPIIRRGQDGYGIVGKLNTVNGVDVNEQGYKYVMEVDKPGKHYVYLWNILTQDDDVRSYVTIEAENFHTLTKSVSYASHTRAITVGNVTTSSSATTNDADKVYYMYVPPKKGAVVPLRLELKDSRTGADIAYGEQDEFLLYSKFLSHYNDSDYASVKAKLPNDPWMTNAHGLTEAHQYFPCQFLPIDESAWGSGGRVYGFTARKTYVDLFHEKANTDHHKSHFSLYMHTNQAASAEMIRISSNDLNAKAAFTTNYVTETATHTTVYTHNMDDSYLYKNKATASSPVYTYRSMLFELRNYPAFRFKAKINGVPSYSATPNLTNEEEPETDIDINYGPNIAVKLTFDVMSYLYDASTTVDPFGQEFQIYIDAPTLKLKAGENDVVAEKDASGDNTGRYIYTVAANDTDHIADIDFVTNEIVSSDKIVVSSNVEQVIFKSKSFNLNNIPISGIIKYADEGSTKIVPKDTFVSFTRELNGSRIGSMTVGENGEYQLRLRKEYDFTWDGVGDKIKLHITIGGKYYSAIFDNVKALYQAKDVTLTPVE